jgi:hypothetical protein
VCDCGHIVCLQLLNGVREGVSEVTGGEGSIELMIEVVDEANALDGPFQPDGIPDGALAGCAREVVGWSNVSLEGDSTVRKLLIAAR